MKRELRGLSASALLLAALGQSSPPTGLHLSGSDAKIHFGPNMECTMVYRPGPPPYLESSCPINAPPPGPSPPPSLPPSLPPLSPPFAPPPEPGVTSGEVTSYTCVTDPYYCVSGGVARTVLMWIQRTGTPSSNCVHNLWQMGTSVGNGAANYWGVRSCATSSHIHGNYADHNGWNALNYNTDLPVNTWVFFALM
jgi:hypothetical protein